MFWDIDFRLCIYIELAVPQSGSEFHSTRNTLTYFTAKKSFFCIHCLKNDITLRFCTHTYIVSVFNFRYDCAIFGPLAYKLEGGTKPGSTSAKTFLDLIFVHVLRYQFEICCIDYVGSATHWVRVYSRSGHSDLLYNQNASKQFFFIYGLKTYIEPLDSVQTLI